MQASKKSQTKLTRTHSSLLRSQSSIDFTISSHHEEEELQDKKHNKKNNKYMNKKYKPSHKPGSTRFFTAPVLFFFSFCISLLYCYFYLGASEELSTSENLLLVLIFIAAGANKTKPVKWYIEDWGESEISEVEEGEKEKLLLDNRIEKEGVEFYSNGDGDFYEGEFHRGKCNGSGVYNYFVRGRYEGDWVDGKYDGYGIESWARGIRYKGQYRQGLRHGYGAYRFYTGDSYAGYSTYFLNFVFNVCVEYEVMRYHSEFD
ncbi:hypothetical protein TanjilG_05016 [Lupinus angustifolius]|uniref:Uncharacterized protein n=1 Tax=Lupinus angustifolius TaxID=3871 RepID=A0A4P1R5H6_LUPAN|nr:hypothetical protein TanjilG_05016 [Lupinus angustifolius]